ncbi:hypothetical protein HDU92_008188 [Lobulomyces angularis]|nr:hypothetical protein HDU92_008188 [Lobulomyces angularis]
MKARQLRQLKNLMRGAVPTMQLRSRSSLLPFRARQNQTSPFDSFFNDPFFSQPFQSILTPITSSLSNQIFSAPQRDIIDTDKEFAVHIEVPGMAKEDINVNLNEKEHILTISGEKKNEFKDEKDGNYSFERSYGKFERVIQLPRNVNLEKVNSSLKDGVLKIKFEKKPDVKEIENEEFKKIEIGSSE